MRKTSLTLALAIGLVGIMGQAWADSEATITVTVELESISVSLDTSAWEIGPITLGGSDTLPTVTATNEGNVDIDLKIKGANGTGGWTIGTPAGEDTFEVALTSPAITLTTSDQSLADAVAPDATTSIDLAYAAPSIDNFGGGVDQGFDITVTASKSP